jgi:hypothetical protein
MTTGRYDANIWGLSILGSVANLLTRYSREAGANLLHSLQNLVRQLERFF